MKDIEVKNVVPLKIYTIENTISPC
jgi:hypothetical protein